MHQFNLSSIGWYKKCHNNKRKKWKSFNKLKNGKIFNNKLKDLKIGEIRKWKRYNKDNGLREIGKKSNRKRKSKKWGKDKP